MLLQIFWMEMRLYEVLGQCKISRRNNLVGGITSTE